jgi:hypothetical protein
MAAIVAGIAVTGAFAQNVCDDLDGATAKYDKFIEGYQKKTEAELVPTIAAGKEFLEKWGACESWKEQVAFVRPWVPRLERTLEQIKEGPMFDAFDKAVAADNIDGIYSAGKQILAKYPNNHNVKYVMAVAALSDVSKAVQAKTQSKYSSEAASAAKTLYEGVKSGSIQLNRKLNDGTPSIGVLKHETNKEEALSRLAYTHGFITYYALNNKKGAVAQYYEVTQIPGYFKNYAPVYVTISDYYRGEAANILKEYAALTNEYNALVDQVKKLGNTPEDQEKAKQLDTEIKAKDVQIKAKEALVNGYIERAMDALARAYSVAKDTTPAEKTYKDGLYKDLQEMYNNRFPAKPAGLKDWIAAATAKPLPDPTSTVQPVSDEPVTTTTTGGAGVGTGTGIGAATGTGIGAAKGTGIGAATGTGIGAATGTGVAPKAGTAAKKP